MNSTIRISCAILCRFKVANGYLLLLNRNRREQGLYELTPVGGAIEFYNPQIIQEFNMQLENPDSADLRFQTDPRNIEAFRAWFNQRQDRETDPFREIYEELVLESQALPDLTRDDLSIRYLHITEDAKTTQRSGVRGLFTQYFLEIFEVVITNPQLEKTLLNLPQASGVVILDESTARNTSSIDLWIDNAWHKARLVTENLF